MSLTTCLKKAGPYLQPGDKSAILSGAREYRAQGLSARESGIKAIEDVLATAKADVVALTKEALRRDEQDTGGLTAPSKQDVLDQQKRREDGERAEAQRRADEEAKVKANAERNDFTLTGSDRAADQGEAHGQQGLFARAQTDTEAFKRWFGDSKVVDDKGRPLVVYHGTTADLSAFDLAFSGSDGVLYDRPAIFATDDARVASDYARNKRNRNIADAGRKFQRFKNENPGVYDEEYERLFEAYKAAGRKEGWDIGVGANVLPLYLSIQNPLEVDGGGQRFMQVMPDAVKQASAEGRDGVIVRNVIDHASPASDYPVTVYVAFDPKQIKSAIGNRGTFDPQNPDIRLARGEDAVLETRAAIAKLRGRLTVAEAKPIVDEMTAGWKDGPQVHVRQSASDLPVRASNVRGLYTPGQVWIVAGAHAQGAGMRKAIGQTLAHEAIAHYGLRNMLGEEGWNRLMDNIQIGAKAGNKQLQSVQDHVRKAYPEFDTRPRMQSDEMAARAVELAIDEDGKFRPGFEFMKSVFARVAEFLRSIGIRVPFSYVELQGMLVRSMHVLEAGQRAEPATQPILASAREDGAMQMRVFHGSPHEFESFSTEKIGTGEGAQAYGWGLYFAGKREVAEHYRRNLTGADGKPVRWDNTSMIPRAAGGTLAQRIEGLEQLVEKARRDIAAAPNEQERGWAEGRLRNAREELAEAKKKGRVYEVQIPEEGEYLLWDKPLSEQPEKVRKALEEAGVVTGRKFGEGFGATPMFPGAMTFSGEAIYRRIVERQFLQKREVTSGARKSSEREASEFLRSLGIRGIKYLDGSSRPGTVMEQRQMDLLEKHDGNIDAALDEYMRSVYNTPARKEKIRESTRKSMERWAKAHHNYVIFDDADVSVQAMYALEQGESDFDGATEARATQPEEAESDSSPNPISPWRDATGRLQFAPGQWLYEALGKAAGPLLTKLQMKSADPALKRALRDMRVTVQKAQDTAAAVATETMKLSEAEREMVSDLIEREMAAGTIPPQHAVRLAAMITDSMNAQSDELVRLGMLTKDSADRWRGQYLPRFYKSKLTEQVGNAWADLFGRQKTMAGIKGKHLRGRGLYETIPESELSLWESQGWEVRDPDYQPGLVGDGTVQVWRDFSRDEREKMGEIRDAGFRFVMGYMQTQRDIALGRMFESLAANPEMSSRNETERFSVQVPDGTVSGTGAKRYGKLAGRWVSKDTMSHLSQIEEAQSEAWRMYRKAMGLWKESKTALNPVSHVNNMLSNLTMAHFAGVPYWRADKYIAAAHDFATKDKAVTEARDAGLFLGTMSDTELMNVLPEDLKALVKQQDSAAQKIGKSAFNFMTFFLRRPMGWAYQAEDTFFRYLLYKDARQRGLDPQDAVDWAQKFIFAYDDLPKGARMVRDFGIPFFSYTYKAMPALLETAMSHPLRFAAPAAVLWGANAAAYAIAVGDEDDDWSERLKRYLTDKTYREMARKKEQLEREHLPPWMKGTTALMTPKAVRLGMDELTKLPVFIDTARIVPGGDLFDVSPNAGGIPLPQPITPSHPLFTAAVAMLANKDMYFGKEVIDANDTRGEAASKRAEWMWKQFSPAIALGNYHWERGLNALAQESGGEIKWLPEAVSERYTGVDKQGTPVQAKYAVAQTFGLKARPIDLELAEQMDRNMRSKMLRDIDAEMRKLQRLNQKGAVSDSVYDKAREKADEKKDRIRAGLTVDGDKKD